MTITRKTPQEWATEAKALGFTVEVKLGSGRSSIITITKSFQAGNAAEYCAAENDAQQLLADAPMTYDGSVWGTDSGSVGGHVGLTSGEMRLSKSGIGSRFAKAVEKAARA